MKKTIAGILAGLCLFLNLLVPVSAAISIPDKTDYYVNDYMNVLNQNTIEAINDKNDRLDKGAEIVVLTTDYINTDTEEFAYQVFNQWGIGDSKRNNGVLIVFVISEGKFWIATGTGIEDVLNSGVVSDIIYDYLESDFDAGNYDRAMTNTVNEIYRILANKYGTVSPTNSDSDFGSGFSTFATTIGFALIIVLILVIAIALPRGPRRYYGGYGRGYHRHYGGGFHSSGSSYRSSGSRSSGSFARSSGRRSSGGGRSRGGGAGRK